MKPLIILTSIISVISATQRAENSPRKQPVFLPEYYKLRDKCNWKPVMRISLDGECANVPDVKAMSCEVDAKTPEGRGIFRIVRAGVFEMTGGLDDVMCQMKVTPAFERLETEVDWLTRSVSVAVDPYTGRLLGFPPIHIHHLAAGQLQGYESPDIPNEYKNSLEWSEVSNFGASSAAAQCDIGAGGVGCFMEAVSPGYGFERFRDVYPETMSYNFHIQDVRAENSPPILAAMEFAIFHLLDPVEPMKSLEEYRIFIGDALTHLYDASQTVPVYQFGTFYSSLQMDYTGSDLHAHSVPGDEVWIVRGTQADLGIPKQLQREVIFERHQPSASRQMSKPVPIDPAVESLDQLKQRMEESLRRAAEEHDTRSNRHIPNKAASAGPQFIPYNRNNPPVPPGRPEILCKYYGTVDQIGPAALVAEKAAYIAAMESHGYHFAGSTLVDEPEAIAALRAAGSAGFDTSGWKVTAAEQAHNLFTGVLPGMYYRRLHSSYDRKEERYQSCNRFSVEPGEQITVVYFNVPRPPAPLGQYNHTEFVMHQHTIYGGEVHMPGLRD